MATINSMFSFMTLGHSLEGIASDCVSISLQYTKDAMSNSNFACRYYAV